MKNKNTSKLIAFLIALIGLWTIYGIIHSMLIWFISINLIAIYIILKYKAFNKKDITAGTVFGVLCMPSNIIMGFSTVLPFIAAMMIFKDSKNRIYMFKAGKRNVFVMTALLILVVGGILSGFNVLLSNSMPVNFSINLKWFFDAMRAGIFEEISFRFFFFALCVYLTKDQPFSRIQNLLCYAIMVIPHVLAHFNFQNFNIIGVIFLCLFFGLPFALMQRKSNLVSAIGSHTVVDLVRFCVYGV